MDRGDIWHYLYYARVIDATSITAVGSITFAKSTNTINNLKNKINQFLDYTTTHLDTNIKYFARKIYLWAQFDVS